MKLALEILAVTFAGIVHHGLGAYFYIKYPDYATRLSKFDYLILSWANSLFTIFVVLLVAYNQPDGFASVGIHLHQGTNNINVILVSVFLFPLFDFMVIIIRKTIYRLRKQPYPPEFDPSMPVTSTVLRYQNKWERRSFLSILPFAAISEDLIYRGYLVLLLGNLTKTFIPWAIISVILSVLIHLYQGRNVETITYHFLHAIIFVGYIIAAKNILAPISVHIFSNLLNTFGVWRQAKKQGIPVASGISKREKISYAIFTGVNITLLITMGIYLL